MRPAETEAGALGTAVAVKVDYTDLVDLVLGHLVLGLGDLLDFTGLVEFRTPFKVPRLRSRTFISRAFGQRIIIKQKIIKVFLNIFPYHISLLLYKILQYKKDQNRQKSLLKKIKYYENP